VETRNLVPVSTYTSILLDSLRPDARVAQEGKQTCVVCHTSKEANCYGDWLRSTRLGPRSSIASLPTPGGRVGGRVKGLARKSMGVFDPRQARRKEVERDGLA